MSYLFVFPFFIHISHTLRVPCGRGRGPRGPDVIFGHGRGHRGLRTFAATVTDGYSNALQGGGDAAAFVPAHNTLCLCYVLALGTALEQSTLK